MQFERWYPTVIPVSGNQVLVIGGSYNGQTARDPSVNQPAELGGPGVRGWTGFNRLVGTAANVGIQVAVVRHRRNKLVTAIMIGNDNRIWRSTHGEDGSFPDFAAHPVGVAANRALRVAVVELENDLLDVYMIGMDNKIWHSVQRPDGTFPDFAGSLVGSSRNLAIDIAAVRSNSAAGGVEVFIVGLDNRMWGSAKRANGTFADFAEHPVGHASNLALKISAVALQNNGLDVYMIGMDNQIWHSVQLADGTFPDFARARVGSSDNLAVEISATKRDLEEGGGVDVFMIGLDGRAWHSLQRANGSFPDFAGGPVAPPSDKGTSISAAAGAHRVFITRTDDKTLSESQLTATFGWRTLSGTAQTVNNSTGWYIYYPWAYSSPNGDVFIAGPTRKTFWISLSGAGAIRAGPLSNVFRDYGSSVMYEQGKILILGGGTTGAKAESSAEIIDLNLPSPKWTATGSMAFQRKHANATVLPDGKVLVTGGTILGGDPTADSEVATNMVYAAELWDPKSGSWSTLPSAASPRLYHSTAILLPDATVLTAGGGQGGGAGSLNPLPDGVVDRPTAQIFSPPYLFQTNGSLAPRPLITSWPNDIYHSQSFSIATPNPNAIGLVVLISLGSATHAFDQSQRRCVLAHSVPAGSAPYLTVLTPQNENVCLSGVYMLFVLDRAGVPSIAKIVRLRLSSQ